MNVECNSRPVYLNFPSLLHKVAMLTAPASAPIKGLVMLAGGTVLEHVAPVLVLVPALGPQHSARHVGAEKKSPSAPHEMSVVAVRTRSHCGYSV